MSASYDQQVGDFLGSFYADFGGFVQAAYPWGEPGTILEGYDGLDTWAQKLADEISAQVRANRFDGKNPVPALRISVASGNGIGKSAFSAMFINWVMMTRPFSVGTVSASSGAQLRTKTWAELIKFTRLSLAADWFDIRSESIRHKQHGAKWAVNATTWNLSSPDSFAGQHSRTSTSYFVIDEASGVPDAIFDQLEGGLTDGEAMLLVLGNLNRRSGRLYDMTYGHLKDRCISKTVDSRTCKYTNHAEIERWIFERGIESDWIKVHVLGEAPASFDLSFIDMDRISAARTRPVPPMDGTEPLIMGLDFARGGSDYNRISYRRGRDARSIPSKGIPGEKTRDTQLMISLVLEEIRDKQPDAIFGDAVGVGGPIMDSLRALVKNVPVIDVQFAGKSPDDKYGNLRAYSWAMMKEWLPGGCIEDNKQLAEQLAAPEFFHTRDRLMLESKEDMAKRDISSPDWADSLALTFSYPIPPKKNKHIASADAARRARNLRGSHGKVKGWMAS